MPSSPVSSPVCDHRWDAGLDAYPIDTGSRVFHLGVGIPHHGMADAPEPVGADRLQRLQHRRHARRPGSGWRDRQWRQQPGRGRTNRLRRPRPSPGRIRLPPRVGADGPGQVEDEFRTFLRCGGEACHDDPAAPTGDGKCPTSMTRLLPRSITSALSRAASGPDPMATVWPRSTFAGLASCRAAHREPGVAWLIEGLPPGHVA